MAASRPPMDLTSETIGSVAEPCQLRAEEAGRANRWATDFCRRCGADKATRLWLIEQDQGGYRPKEEFVRAVNERLAPSEPLTVDGFRTSFAELFSCDPSVLGALSRVREGAWRIGVVTNGSPIQLDKVVFSDLSDAAVVCVRL